MRRLRVLAPAAALAAVSVVGLPGCHPSGWEACNAYKPGPFWTVTVVTHLGNNYWDCNAILGGEKKCYLVNNNGDHQVVYFGCTTQTLSGEPF